MRQHNNPIYFQAYGPNTLSQAIMGTWTHLPPTRFSFQTAVVDQNRCFTVVLRCCFFSSCPTPLSAARRAALKIGFWPHKSYESLVEPCLSAIISQPECWFWNFKMNSTIAVGHICKNIIWKSLPLSFSLPSQPYVGAKLESLLP